MKKQTNIIVNFAIEGLHCWKDAAEKAPKVNFLQHGHRHMFHICCKKKVSHDDRDIEIILFKREIQAYLCAKYGEEAMAVKIPLEFESETTDTQYVKMISHCDFRSRSCEMIAEELLDKFELEYCSVLEDGENGAEIYKID